MIYGPLLLQGAAHRGIATRPPRSISCPITWPPTLMFGHQLLLPIPDIDRTDFFPDHRRQPGGVQRQPDDRAGLSPSPQGDTGTRRSRSWCWIPRRTETAALADAHHFVRPGSDACCSRRCCTRCSTKACRAGRLADSRRSCETCPTVAPFSPGSRCRVVGLDANHPRLTREFCSAELGRRLRPHGRLGAGLRRLCQWLINVINIVSGNFDRPGGAMFTRPAADILNTGTAAALPVSTAGSARCRNSVANCRWPPWPRICWPAARTGSARC